MQGKQCKQILLFQEIIAIPVEELMTWKETWWENYDDLNLQMGSSNDSNCLFSHLQDHHSSFTNEQTFWKKSPEIDQVDGNKITSCANWPPCQLQHFLTHSSFPEIWLNSLLSNFLVESGTASDRKDDCPSQTCDEDKQHSHAAATLLELASIWSVC